MPVVVNIRDAQANLVTLVKRAAAGEQITLAYLGKPMAILTRRPAKTKKLPWGKFKGRIEMASDFDAPVEVFKDYV